MALSLHMARLELARRTPWMEARVILNAALYQKLLTRSLGRSRQDPTVTYQHRPVWSVTFDNLSTLRVINPDVLHRVCLFATLRAGAHMVQMSRGIPAEPKSGCYTNLYTSQLFKNSVSPQNQCMSRNGHLTHSLAGPCMPIWQSKFPQSFHPGKGNHVPSRQDACKVFTPPYCDRAIQRLLRPLHSIQQVSA